ASSLSYLAALRMIQQPSHCSLMRKLPACWRSLLLANYDRGSPRQQRSHHAHGDNPAGSRIGLGWHTVDLKAQRTERSFRHDLVTVTLNARIGDDPSLCVI